MLASQQIVDPKIYAEKNLSSDITFCNPTQQWHNPRIAWNNLYVGRNSRINR